MTKKEMKSLFCSSVGKKILLRTYMKYDPYYRYYIPLAVGEKLFLGAEEDDFILDGFSIRRFCDLTKLEVRNDKCVDIVRAEGLFEKITPPAVDLTDWHSVFLSLQKRNANIIIEKDSADPDEWEYWIGRIEKVLKTKLRFRHFDADGKWMEEPYEIPFSKITSVTFGSRYVEVFSRYLQPCDTDQKADVSSKKP